MIKINCIKYYFHSAFLCLLVIVLSSCEDRTKLIDTPTIQGTKNQTVKKLKFTLNDSAEVTVKLRNLVSGKELYLETPKRIHHESLLAGLKPNMDYSIQIFEKKNLLKQIDTFHTDPIEENVVSIYKRTMTPNTFDGYLLTQRRLVKGSVYMLDNEGDLVWYQMANGQPKLSHWTKNNEVLILVGDAKHNNSAGDRILAYTIDGEVSYEIDLKPLGLIAHHEVLELENDLVFLAYDTKPNMVNGEIQEAITSSIIRLTKGGEIVWKWSTFDIKNPEGITAKEMDGDWGHANSFMFDTDGNIIISYRDWNQLCKVDVKTGKMMWLLGENGDFKFEGTPFNGQHAIHLNSEGDYMLFDNGKKNRQSRIVSYQLKDSVTKEEIAINLPEHLYADRMGNVGILPNGNFLLCSPRSRSIAVLNLEGEILFHINTGIPDPYRVTYIPSFFSKQ